MRGDVGRGDVGRGDVGWGVGEAESTLWLRLGEVGRG